MELGEFTFFQFRGLVSDLLVVAIRIEPFHQKDLLTVAEEIIRHSILSELLVSGSLFKDILKEVNAASLEFLIPHDTTREEDIESSVFGSLKVFVESIGFGKRLCLDLRVASFTTPNEEHVVVGGISFGAARVGLLELGAILAVVRLGRLLTATLLTLIGLLVSSRVCLVHTSRVDALLSPHRKIRIKADCIKIINIARKGVLKAARAEVIR